MPAELYPSNSSSTLIVKKDTKGKDGFHEKRFDRLPVYHFAGGLTSYNNDNHW
jgi:hypothetical protein